MLTCSPNQRACCVFLSKGGLVKDDAKEFVGAATKVKVAKNKLAPPFRECMFDMMFGQGICKRGELLDLGVATGLLARQGAWYAFTEDGAAALGPAAAAPADGGDDAAATDATGATEEAISAAAKKKKKKGAAKKKAAADDDGSGGPRPFAQGREKAKAYFEANQDVADALEGLIRAKLLPAAGEQEPSSSSDSSEGESAGR